VFSRDLPVLPAHSHVHPQLEWAIPAFAFPAIAGAHFPTLEGWKAELVWVAGYTARQFACPKAVTHPTTNWTRCRATALIETNATLNRHSELIKNSDVVYLPVFTWLLCGVWLVCGLLAAYRDLFYELVRDWEEHHLTSGWSVRSCQLEKIRGIINLGRDSLANCLHLARLFVLQLIQVISYRCYCLHAMVIMTHAGSRARALSGLRGWKNRPDSFATVINSSLVVDPQSNFLDPGFIFTDVSDHCWIVFGQARATVMHATRNGVSLTTNCVTVEKSRQCHTSSTLVHWPNLTAVYCAYMKQMPSTGWQHMALRTR